jgi:hypothetical protein
MNILLARSLIVWVGILLTLLMLPYTGMNNTIQHAGVQFVREIIYVLADFGA